MLDGIDIEDAFSFTGPDDVPKFYPPDSPEVIDLIQNHQEKVDYTRIWPKTIPVLFIGEEHQQARNINEFTKRILPTKDQLGVTHVGLEMVKKNQQTTLDKYLNRELSREDMLKSLGGWESWEGDKTPERYLSLIDAIHKSGIKILALDSDYEEEKHTIESMAKRNEDWANILDRTIKEDPRVRIVVYCGYDHARYDIPNTANELLKNKGIQSIVTHFIMGLTKWRNNSDLHTSIANTAIDAQDNNYKRFALDLAYMGDKRPVDYAIHLPFLPGLPNGEDDEEETNEDNLSEFSLNDSDLF